MGESLGAPVAPIGVDLSPIGDNLRAVSRVLVVEDDPDHAELLGLVLREAGHDTSWARSNQEALGLLQTFRPHTVFCDLQLALQTSGIDFARSLRRDPAHAHVVLVALSGYRSTEAKRLARSAGFDRYLVKPVDLNTIEEIASDTVPPPPL